MFVRVYLYIYTLPYRLVNVRAGRLMWCAYRRAGFSCHSADIYLARVSICDGDDLLYSIPFKDTFFVVCVGGRQSTF